MLFEMQAEDLLRPSHHTGLDWKWSKNVDKRPHRLAVVNGFVRPWPLLTHASLDQHVSLSAPLKSIGSHCSCVRSRCRLELTLCQLQTASRSVQPFLRTQLQWLPMLFNGADNPQKLPLPLGGSGPHLMHGSEPTRVNVPPPKRHFDQFSHCCRDHERQTHSTVAATQSNTWGHFP